ncbi:hypothetical protein JCM6882_003779 [Rhodosporidiobolus microsporus]
MRNRDYQRRDQDAPLSVKVVVYDLLPPSRFAQLLNLCGTGVYHSSVQLSIPLGPSDTHDPSPNEYAFGGHDSPGTSGIFSIPAGTAAQRMPGLRYYMTVDCGEAFGPDWEREFFPSRREQAGGGSGLSRVSSALSVASGGSGSVKGKQRAGDADETVAGPPYGGWMSFSRSTTTLTSQAEDPFKDPTSPDVDEPFEEDDGGASDGTEYLTKAERRAWRIIQAMKQDDEWNGTSYRLLEKNCNTFTHELVYRLTGRKALAWLNRAAWVATSLPCIVPAGWIDDAEETAPTAESTSSIHVPDPAHALSKDGNVTIAPPRADRMELGGRT